MHEPPALTTFTYTQLPVRVVFGAGRLAGIAAEVAALGSRALVLSTPRTALAQRVSDLLGALSVGIQANAAEHVPQTAIDVARAVVRDRQADVLVAPGGGSTIGLAKGIALASGLPIVALPTTYAGSEMTHIWGIARDGIKTTGRNPIVKPRTVIYDPELLLSLPPALSLTSGINALAHAAEALYAADANPIASLMAEQAVAALAHSLPAVVADPADLAARSASLYGAWLAASVLDMVGMALHHKLCHTLGGSFNLPHAATHTVVLPHALHYNLPAAPQAQAALARALRCAPADVAGAVYDLVRANGGPLSLRALGLRDADLAQAADLAAANPYPNPRPVTRAALLALLTQAFDGQRPPALT